MDIYDEKYNVALVGNKQITVEEKSSMYAVFGTE